MELLGMKWTHVRSAIRGAGLLGVGALSACAGKAPDFGVPAPDVRAAEAADPATYWNSATVYFLLIDRFRNGDPSNDRALGRTQDGPVLRTFQGGDLVGVLEMLEEGYFEALGVDAIWMTPFQEQNRDRVDEGSGETYAYHGYWIQDWTAVDPALGTEEDLRAVVEAAHERGIRVIMDAIINHTGPPTARDPAWPADWVRMSPNCTYEDYASTVTCVLADTLSDIRTESDMPVELPRRLLEKWQHEGRLVQEMGELEAFFERTGYPKAPRYYLIKWLTDWVRELGFDGYRVDTAKHFEEWVSAELKTEAERAFADWKAAHPDRVRDDLPFYMMGEVYNYNINNGRQFTYDGGDVVDFFDYGYDALINFDFKERSNESLDDLFARYAAALDDDLRGVSIVNYVSSHDDDSPWDPGRERPRDAGTRLLLAPGGAQIYYGDELARPLRVDGAEGDANLRSNMNWDDLAAGGETAEILEHWRKLGQFRLAHPAVGAGVHEMHQAEPYIFSRILELDGVTDCVLVAMGQVGSPRTVPVFGVFPEGTELVDTYSGETGIVTDGVVSLAAGSDLVLLAARR